MFLPIANDVIYVNVSMIDQEDFCVGGLELSLVLWWNLDGYIDRFKIVWLVCKDGGI